MRSFLQIWKEGNDAKITGRDLLIRSQSWIIDRNEDQHISQERQK